MRQVAGGEQLTDSVVTHLDRCLGCMACVPACPSGVQYGKLIEGTRTQIEQTYDRRPRQRALRSAIFAVFPYPRRLRLVAGPLRLYQRSGLQAALRRSALYRQLPATLRTLDSLTPSLAPLTKLPGRIPAVGRRRAVVGMLTGCVQSVFFPRVNAATARVLSAEGCDVITPRNQGCCGALSAHNGREREAMAFARSLIDKFIDARVDAIVVNSAGCGSAMKEYGHLLRDDPQYAAKATEFASRTRDIAEFLDELGPVAPRHPLPGAVAYHDACHLANAQGVRNQPRRLLAGIPGLVVREVADGNTCCGSGGVYNLLETETAARLGARKAANVAATEAPAMVAGNPGCLMHIAASLAREGKNVTVAHTIEVLDASITGETSMPPG